MLKFKMFKYIFVPVFTIIYLPPSLASLESLAPLESGDFIFVKDKLHVSHVGIVEGNQVISADPKKKAVIKCHLSEFHRLKPEIFVKRLRQPYSVLIPLALKFANDQLGAKYNHSYVLSEGSKPLGHRSFCCSGLIYHAFLNANKGQEFFKSHPMDFSMPDPEFWVKYHEQKGLKMPVGESGIRPGNIFGDDRLEIVPPPYNLDGENNYSSDLWI